MKRLRQILLIIISIILIISIIFIGRILFIHYRSIDGLCIVGYHGVVSDQDKEEKYSNNRYFLSESQFERQMQYLYDHQYQTLNMDEVYAYYNGELEISNNSIVLTFDDGYKNFNTVVKPILEKYNFKGTCFVIGKHLNDDDSRFLKEDDIINTSLISYYSHSYNLHRISKGFDRKIIQDLSINEINEDFKNNLVDSTYFAFPYGRSVKGVEDVLKNNNVKLAFSYNQFKNMTRDDNQYYLPRYMIVDIMPDIYFHWVVS